MVACLGAALLGDEQVREFIANGFVPLTPDVPLALQDEIDGALRRSSCRSCSMPRLMPSLRPG